MPSNNNEQCCDHITRLQKNFDQMSKIVNYIVGGLIFAGAASAFFGMFVFWYFSHTQETVGGIVNSQIRTEEQLKNIGEDMAAIKDDLINRYGYLPKKGRQ